jgi:anti-anti-sigma factor
MDLTFTHSSDGAVKLTGDLDLHTGFLLRETLLELVTSKSEIRLDLSDVRTCDWVALQLLCSTRKSALAVNKPFSISALSPAVVEASTAIGLPLAALSDNPTS